MLKDPLHPRNWLPLTSLLALSLTLSPYPAFADDFEDLPPPTAPDPSFPEPDFPPPDLGSPAPEGLTEGEPPPPVGLEESQPPPPPPSISGGPAPVDDETQAELDSTRTSDPSEIVPSDELPLQNTSVAVEARDPRVPLYKLHRPTVGVSLNLTHLPLGSESSFSTLPTETFRGGQFQVEWQPRFIQRLGVLGLGPSLGVYYSVNNNGSGGFQAVFRNWSAGAQVRYQLRYFREQFLVPMAGYAFEYLTYSVVDGPKGHVPIQGPFFGGMFLLNVVEPDAAAEFFADKGVSRSYLLAEARMLAGQDANISIEGLSYFFGVRVEF